MPKQMYKIKIVYYFNGANRVVNYYYFRNLANKWPPTFISNKKARRLADVRHKCFGQNKIKSPYYCH